VAPSYNRAVTLPHTHACSGSILLVDDDEDLRGVIGEVLVRKPFGFDAMLDALGRVIR